MKRCHHRHPNLPRSCHLLAKEWFVSVSPHRPAAVAGTFYPAQAAALRDDIATRLARARTTTLTDLTPKALIVPHAGYIYSGDIAATAYAMLAAAHQPIRRIALLGPAHRVAVRGLALPEADAFDTPLGSVLIDLDAARCLDDLPQVTRNAAAHALEHSLEVQLPFLQHILDDFLLLPLAVGQASEHEVAEVLERLWGGPETLIIISSDLSHYQPYAVAERTDQATAKQIVALQALTDHEQACAATPINGLLHCARRFGLHAHLIARCNSGDTAGERSRVVGYASFAFSASTQEPA
jgi:AmmeMemoRadiSam system protein B